MLACLSRDHDLEKFFAGMWIAHEVVCLVDDLAPSVKIHNVEDGISWSRVIYSSADAPGLLISSILEKGSHLVLQNNMVCWARGSCT